MITLITVTIVVAVICYIYYITHGNHEEIQEGAVEQPQESLTEKHPPEKLMDLNTTTVADRQRAYKRGFRQQLLFDAVQREAEAKGDTDTLEAIRLGIYTGPFPQLEEDTPRLVLSKPKGNPNAPVQKIKYFCIKDKGYHVSVWPKDYSQFDIVEFNISGMSHREGIDDYIGEFKGTLVPEPDNPYDSNAIKVLAADGHHVGYVPKDMTSEVRKNADLPCPCFCYIGCNEGVYFSDCYIIRK